MTDTIPKRRGRPPKNPKPAAAPATVTGDPHDKKLDHFQYRADEHDMEVWQNTDISPMSVPKAIKDKYPHLRFRYVANRTWDTKGKEYHGWQEFKDPELAPGGIKRGNDTFLAAMPEERALQYNKYVSQRSRDAVRALQEKQVDMALAIEQGAYPGISDAVGDGLVIATDKSRSGYSTPEIRELIRKRREDHEKKRKYFFAK